MSERHALGAQLRFAAEALDAGHAERAQEILRDIPLNAGREAPRSFVWRYLWRRARREIIVLFGPTPRVTGMALSPDGALLVTSDGLADLKLWNVASGAWIRDLERGPGRNMRPTFSLDGSLVAAEDRDAGLSDRDGFAIWDVASGRRLVRLPLGKDFSALDCSFLPNRELLGSGFRNQPDNALTRLWNLADDPSRPRLVEQSQLACRSRYSDAGWRHPHV